MQILGPVVGGLLAILGGVLVALTSDRRERLKWRRDAQLAASAELLTALQTLIRRMLDLAFLAEKRTGDPGLAAVARYHDATIKWNSAMYTALLVSPPEISKLISALDREADRLLNEAMTRQWERTEFRVQRRELGRLAAGYLQKTREMSALPDIDLKSIWAWDVHDESSVIQQAVQQPSTATGQTERSLSQPTGPA